VNFRLLQAISSSSHPKIFDTTTGGLTSNIVSIHLLKLTKEANDRLDQMAKDLKDED
jgi:hypothetical protein